MTEILYRELQKMAQPKIGLIMAAVFILAEVLIVYAYLAQIGQNPLPISVTVVVTILLIFLIYLALFMKVVVTVTESEIYIRSFINHKILKKDIIGCEIVEFRPMRDFGGWGIRFFVKGTGYICPGTKRGVRLERVGHTALTISSNDADALMDAISR